MDHTGVPRHTGGYRKVVVAVSIGSFIEIYDAVLYGYFATVLAAQFMPEQDPTAGLLATFAIFAVGFLVNPIGAIVFGHLGDRIGRRRALAASLLLMTVATVSFGLLPTYATVGVLAPVLLLVCRIMQGLSVSAEIPGAQLFIMEYAPPGRQGRTVAINNVAGNLGGATAATVGLVLAWLLPPDQLAGWGWRAAFLAAAPLGLVGWYLRTHVLDSAAFVALGALARQGRAPLTRALATAKRGMLVLVCWTAASAIGGFLLAGFLPSYLVRVAGLTPADAFTANLVAILLQAGSALAGGYLADRFPLRRVAIAIMAGIAVTVVPGFLLITTTHTLTGALVGQGLWAIFIGASYSVGAVLAIRMFPAAIRFTALAVSFNVGITLFGSTAPYVSTWLVATTASSLSPAVYLAVAAIGGLLAVAVGLPAHRSGDPAQAGAPLRVKAAGLPVLPVCVAWKPMRPTRRARWWRCS
jgi:MHS family proline/betaine transporter-like MFS transporter